MSLSLSHYDEYHKETNSEHVQNTSNTHQHGRPSSDSLNVNVKMDTEVISKENSATWNHLQESELETNHLLTNQIHELFPLFNQRSSNILGTNNGILKIVNTPNTSNTISTDDLKIFVKTLSLTMLHNGPLDTSVMKFALGFENAINFE
ncbi:9285_t:CDS:2, partial [Entrophospora sp. SA101]